MNAASPWVRAGAMLTDVLLVSLLQQLLVLGLRLPDGVRGPLGFLLAFAYHIGLLANGGQTVGKMLAGVVVVDKDGGPLTLKSALVRYVALITTGLLGFFAFFEKDGRAVHDHAAGTRVVYAGEPGTVRLFFFGALGAAWIAVPVAVVILTIVAFPKLASVTRIAPARSRPAPPVEVAAAFDRAPSASVETPSQLPPRPEIPGRTDDVVFNPAVARFQRQVKPEAVKLDADWPELPAARKWSDQHEVWSQHESGLRAERQALQDQLYRLRRAHPRQLFPADLSGLRAPRIKLPDHPATAAVTVYGPEACTGEQFGLERIDGTKLKDTGGWGYVGDPRAICAGTLFLDCTHQGLHRAHFK